MDENQKTLNYSEKQELGSYSDIKLATTFDSGGDCVEYRFGDDCKKGYWVRTLIYEDYEVATKQLSQNIISYYKVMDRLTVNFIRDCRIG